MQQDGARQAGQEATGAEPGAPVESAPRDQRRRGGKTGRPRANRVRHATAEALAPPSALTPVAGEPVVAPTGYLAWKAAFMQALGEVVREGRLGMELPQAHLAEAVKQMGEHISDAQVNRLENNKGWAERSLFAVLAVGIRIGLAPSELMAQIERRMAGNAVRTHLHTVLGTAELLAELGPEDVSLVRAYIQRLRNTAQPPTPAEERIGAGVQEELRRMHAQLGGSTAEPAVPADGPHPATGEPPRA